MMKETRISTLDLLNAQSKGATHFSIDENGEAVHFQEEPTKVVGQRGLWTAIDQNGERIYFKKSRR